MKGTPPENSSDLTNDQIIEKLLLWAASQLGVLPKLHALVDSLQEEDSPLEAANKIRDCLKMLFADLDMSQPNEFKNIRFDRETGLWKGYQPEGRPLHPRKNMENGQENIGDRGERDRHAFYTVLLEAKKKNVDIFKLASKLPEDVSEQVTFICREVEVSEKEVREKYTPGTVNKLASDVIRKLFF